MQPTITWTADELEILPDLQRQICETRSRGYSYQDIARGFGLSGNGAVATCIRRTLAGNKWSPGMGPGGSSYLSDIDSIIFVKTIETQGADLNCLKTAQAMSVAYGLRTARVARANELVTQMKLVPRKGKNGEDGGIQRTLRSLEEYVPSTSWLHEFCSRNDIRIKNPETLEQARRTFCNSAAIRAFFRNNSEAFRKDPRLLFNADETSSASSKKFKVLCSALGRPITPDEDHEEHYTGIFPFNAAGEKLKATIIIPGIKNFPDELQGIDCHLFSQANGWMTTYLFGMFCINFSHDVSVYRLSLPKELRSEEVILIVDCHPSRINSFAVEYLHKQNIRLITLPAHTTHVLQPFDVVVARSLKSSITKYKLSFQQNEQLNKINTARGKARYAIVASMVYAWKRLDPCVLIQGFQQTGISPCEERMPLSSPYIPPPNAAGAVFNLRRGTFDISNKDLSCDQERIRLAEKCYQTNYASVDDIPKPLQHCAEFYMNKYNLREGMVLSPPSMLVRISDDGRLFYLY